jgi:hypothetical protein
VLEPSAWHRHPVLPDDDLAQWPPLHAVVAIADAHGGHADIPEADEVCRPGCGWRRPLTPGGLPAWEVSNEHLLDVAVPILVAAGDLASADVPAFRWLAPRFPGRLAELLRQLQVAEPAGAGRR